MRKSLLWPFYPLTVLKLIQVISVSGFPLSHTPVCEGIYWPISLLGKSTSRNPTTFTVGRSGGAGNVPRSWSNFWLIWQKRKVCLIKNELSVVVCHRCLFAEFLSSVFRRKLETVERLLNIHHSFTQNILNCESVADPGFPRRGRQPLSLGE